MEDKNYVCSLIPISENVIGYQCDGVLIKPEEMIELYEKDKVNLSKSIPFSYLKYIIKFDEKRQLYQKNDNNYKEDEKLFKRFRVEPKIINWLYTYQKDVLKKFINLYNGRGIIAIPPGGGKTIVGLLLANYYGSKNALFLVPPNKIDDWYKAYLQYNPSMPRPQIIRRGDVKIRSNYIITSFDVCSKYTDLLEKEWDYIGVDEAHKLKGKNTKRFEKLSVMLTKQTKSIALLTATPEPNRPIDLFNLLFLCKPDVFQTKEDYIFRYCNYYIVKVNIKKLGTGAINLEELNCLLSCLMMKTDVILQLPPFTRDICWISPTKEDLKKDDIKLVGETLEVIKTKRLSLPPYDLQQQQITNDHWTYCGIMKLLLLLEHKTELEEIINNQNNKIVIYSYHLVILDKLEKWLKDKWLYKIDREYIRLDSQLLGSIKHQKIQKYQLLNSPTRIILATPGSCGEGLDFTPSNIAIFIELEWTPTLMYQAESRLHRKGAKTPIKSIWYLLKDEEEIYWNKFQMVAN